MLRLIQKDVRARKGIAPLSSASATEYVAPWRYPRVLPRAANTHRMPCHGAAAAGKRLFDILFSLLLLMLLLPLMLGVALAIRLETPGPVFFTQLRGGRGGRPFRLVKFRTMYREAGDDPRAPQAVHGDARITPLGRFLRRTSLDELPQLFNVLKGDMSLIGPRPHARVHDMIYRACIEGYVQRYRMRPGITGWAQVHDLRGPTETLSIMQARVAHDNHYIDHWSPLLDLKIAFRTVGVVLRAVNAV